VGEQELFTLAVAIAGVMIVGRAVASRFEVPEPIVLVVLGILASLIPRMPVINLHPDVVLQVFVPPLVYYAAFLSGPGRSGRTRSRSPGSPSAQPRSRSRGWAV
jgi:hypothetical protein